MNIIDLMKTISFSFSSNLMRWNELKQSLQLQILLSVHSFNVLYHEIFIRRIEDRSTVARALAARPRVKGSNPAVKNPDAGKTGLFFDFCSFFKIGCISRVKSCWNSPYSCNLRLFKKWTLKATKRLRKVRPRIEPAFKGNGAVERGGKYVLNHSVKC